MDQKIINQINSIIRRELKPGTDRGSTQAIIDTRDTRDIEKAAEAIYNEVFGDSIKILKIDNLTPQQREEFAEKWNKVVRSGGLEVGQTYTPVIGKVEQLDHRKLK